MNIRPTAHYSLIQGLFWGSFAALFGFSSVYLLAKGFSNTQIGYLMAASGAASALFQPIAGSIADRSKKLILHHFLIVLSILAIALCGAMLGVGNGIIKVAIFYCLLSTALQVMTPLLYSLGMYFIEHGISINFGICRGIGSITYAMVAAFLGILIERLDENAVIISVIVIYVFFILAVATFHFRGVSEQKNSMPEESSHEGKSLIDFITKNRQFTFILIGNIFVFISHTIIGNYMYQIVTYRGYSSKEMGVAVSLAATCELPTLFLLSRINKKISSGNLLRISVIFMFLKNLFLFFATNIAFIYFSMSLQLLGYGLFAGISVIYVNEIVDSHNKTMGQSLMNMTVTMGGLIGSLLGGKLLDMINVPGMLLVSGITALIGAMIVCAFSEKGRSNVN
ncbi:MFS transporter [Butyrivibrio sp. INlla16]|uniref:MFS transporter n=2 Tax=unclassified Butyrivibrio TaxID=2639466 RepID=UPI0008910A46|nr:MFS transporter [Butyrivibrio sp. INlla16]SDB53609.1 MFS transporter, PPP family, 3-phenylpropionic acid transporter [Butyrivibrio sp. INlla16]